MLFLLALFFGFFRLGNFLLIFYHGGLVGAALQIHGSIGLSNEMPFSDWVMNSYHIALADGPTEVHKVTVAREVLKEFEPTSDLFPDYHLLNEHQRALDLYGDLLDELAASG